MSTGPDSSSGEPLEFSLRGLGPAFDAEYDALPEAVKMNVTKKEFAWMPPHRRAVITDEITLPEAFAD